MNKNNKIKLLNLNEINKFLNKNYPNLFLEMRSKQFIESYIFLYAKNLIKESFLLTKHRKSKILQTRDLKTILIKNSIKSPDLSYVFEKLTKKNKN